MERKYTTLGQFLARAVRDRWFLLYGGVWSLFGAATRIGGNFLPARWNAETGIHHMLAWIPAMDWRTWIVGILAGLAFAIIWSAHLQLRARETAYFDARDEVDRVAVQAPFLVMLTIHKVLHRSLFETRSHLIRDVFLRVSADLISPETAHVEYELEIVLRGKTVRAEWLRDVDEWCWTESVYSNNPFDHNEDRLCYTMDELAARLHMGQKIEGWLHFGTIGLREGELAKCEPRLIVKSGYGACHIDLPEDSVRFISRGKIISKKGARTYLIR